MGTKNLTEILSEREKIAETMQSSLDSATDPWGVKVGPDWRTRGHVTRTCSPLIGRQVERVEIKDVRLPLQLQRAMAAEAEAAREARAKVMNIGGKLYFRRPQGSLFNLREGSFPALKFLPQVIAAEGEQKASGALRVAAEVIQQSPNALQLRYLQTLTGISTEQDSTIVFPMPMSMASFSP